MEAEACLSAQDAVFDDCPALLAAVPIHVVNHGALKLAIAKRDLRTVARSYAAVAEIDGETAIGCVQGCTVDAHYLVGLFQTRSRRGPRGDFQSADRDVY